MWENRVLVVEEADVISRYHGTARVSSTEAGYCFATYFFTSVLYAKNFAYVIFVRITRFPQPRAIPIG